MEYVKILIFSTWSKLIGFQWCYLDLALFANCIMYFLSMALPNDTFVKHYFFFDNSCVPTFFI